MRHIRIWAALMLATLLVACGANQPAMEPTAVPAGPTNTAAGTTARLPVVATFSVLGDLVQNIGGDLVEVTTLVGPGGDAHTFEPTPADSAKLAGAQVIFENGLEFETWFDDLYAASGSQATRVVVTEGIEPLAAAEEQGHAEEGHEEEGHEEGAAEEGAAEEEHGHGEYDPHVWHDVEHAKTLVANIRDGLAAADPANTATYGENAERYLAELTELDAFVKQQVEQIPAENRKLVTSHDTFGYFAQRYGFEIVGTALGSVSTETADPPASEIAELVTDIKAAGVPAIFAENIANPGVMTTIAREAGVMLAPPLFTDALGEPGSAGATYIDMIRSNATTIAEALRG
jgi:zinc/manganese transport system substrate-binding protein